MVRRYRPTETPTTPTVPMTREQLREEDARLQEEARIQEQLHPTILCSCYNYIDARHLARHQRSKRHRDSIAWYLNYHINQISQSNQPVQHVPVSAPTIDP